MKSRRPKTEDELLKSKLTRQIRQSLKKNLLTENLKPKVDVKVTRDEDITKFHFDIRIS